MSVIGRLDEQVDAVLIAPLKKRDGRKTDTTPPGETETETAEPSSQTVKPTPPGDKVSEAEASSSATRDQLPVWLL